MCVEVAIFLRRCFSSPASAGVVAALTLNRVAVVTATTQHRVGDRSRLRCRRTPRGLEFSQGAVGEQGVEWIRARLRLPAEAMPRAPVDIASARVRWPGVQTTRSARRREIPSQWCGRC
jgi:hypothetical protein